MAATKFTALESKKRLKVLRFQVRVGADKLSIREMGQSSCVTGLTLTDHMTFLFGARPVAQSRQGRSIICTAFVCDHLHSLSDLSLDACCTDWVCQWLTKQAVTPRAYHAQNWSSLISDNRQFFGLVLFDQAQVVPVFQFIIRVLLNTALYVLCANTAVTYLKVTNDKNLRARAFPGCKPHMFILATLLGCISSFLLLRSHSVYQNYAGTMSAASLFEQASPLIDTAISLIKVSKLGIAFAIAEPIIAI